MEYSKSEEIHLQNLDTICSKIFNKYFVEDELPNKHIVLDARIKSLIDKPMQIGFLQDDILEIECNFTFEKKFINLYVNSHLFCCALFKLEKDGFILSDSSINVNDKKETLINKIIAFKLFSETLTKPKK